MNDSNQDKATEPARETTLTIEGMTCGSCVRHVDRALRTLRGVDKVEVKLRDGIAIVQHDASKATVGALIAALREAGYESQARSERVSSSPASVTVRADV